MKRTQARPIEEPRPPSGRSGALGRWWREPRWRLGPLVYTGGGLVVLFCLLLGGDFGFQIKDRAAPPTLQLLLGHFKASDLVTGLLLISLPQAIAVVASPVFGYLSDRHRGPRGRRIPFLFALTPVAVAGMAGLAFGPAAGRWLHHALAPLPWSEGTTVILVLAVCWTVFEFSSIVCNGLLVALFTDVVPRAVVGRFFALFRVMALAAGMAFNYFLLGRAEKHYTGIFLLIAAVYGVSFGLMCLKVKEGEYPPPPAKAAPTGGRAAALAAATRTYVREALTLPYYRWIFAALALGYMAIMPFNLYVVYYAQSLGVTMAALGKYISLMLLISLLQSYPVGWLLDRFHPLRVTLVAAACFVMVNVAVFFAGPGQAAFGAIVIISGVMAGFWATAFAPLGTMLFPREKFGVFYSVQLIAAALGQMLVAPLCGWSLDRMAHDYRIIFLWAGGLGALAVGAYVMVYRRFLAYGGVKGYVAPE